MAIDRAEGMNDAMPFIQAMINKYQETADKKLEGAPFQKELDDFFFELMDNQKNPSALLDCLHLVQDMIGQMKDNLQYYTNHIAKYTEDEIKKFNHARTKYVIENIPECYGIPGRPSPIVK